MKHITPINDFFFRYLFGKQGHEHLTLDFINAVLGNVGMGPLQKLAIRNPFSLRESVTGKEIILDIKAEDESANLYNIEMQLQGNATYANRSLYYWAKTYSTQIDKGDGYHQLYPVICINILDFALFKENLLPHQCFLLKELHNEQVILSDHLMLHFLCLTTFKKMRNIVATPLRDWLSWFCHDEDNMKGLETILKSNNRVREAHERYEQFTADQELMARYEARMKYLHDVATFREEGRTKGYAEGKVEGKAEGIIEGEFRGKSQGAATEKIQVAKKMIRNGEPIEKIMDYTGLSKETIESLDE